MDDVLRITIAAILLLMMVGVLNQVGSFLAALWGSRLLLKWTNILVIALTAIILMWWTYSVY